MSTLNKLDELLEEIKSSPLIKRFRELESIIDNNPKLQKDYQDLLEKQKKMVNSKEFKRTDYQVLKADYESHKEGLVNNIIIDEYLELQQKINDDLQLIQDIIGSEINKEFE